MVGQHRYDPFLEEWVIYSPNRNVRPFQGKKFEPETSEKPHWTCPFCPDAPEGAGQWTVKQLPNKYASLDQVPEGFSPKDLENNPLYRYSEGYGKCEVILYSQDHEASFGTLSLVNIEALIELWKERYIVIAQDSQLRYTFIMENRGKEVGNSMTHPHGQIYAFPYIPPRPQKKFNAFSNYFEKTGKCLQCDLLVSEIKYKTRLITENEFFIAEVPYYAHWAYEIHIIAKLHLPSLKEFESQHIKALASIMRTVVRKYDILFGDGKIMPYMMNMFNAPINIDENERDKWHFHIEFYTPFRGHERWKIPAGVESGMNTFLSDVYPEDSARILREIIPDEN